VDLVLQRAGRLHRHEENFRGKRPKPVSSPALSLTLPAISGGLPDLGRDRYVYEPAVLLKSFVTLRQRDELSLPDQTTALIESVYGGQPLPVDAHVARAIQNAEREAEQERRKALLEAAKRLVAGPEDEELLFSRNENLEEEDEGVHEALRALTRLAEPGVSLVCLFRTENGLALDRDGRGAPLDLGREPRLEEVRGLLGASVTVQNGQVVNYFLGTGAEMAPTAWQRSAPLRNHYPLFFDANGDYALVGTKLVLHLEDETGLEIRRM
jgi:CRISPR-associated endonuclease/helicase Cas3